MSGYNQGMRDFFDRTNYFHVVNFAFFLKISLLFNVFYCFYMFVNKHFANFTGI